MRRLVAAAFAMITAASGAIVLGGAPAAAAAPTAKGWWSRTAITGLVPTAGPTVPPGGLYVGGDVSGALGISALRYEVTAGELPLRLTLAIESAQGAPAVIACPATYLWVAEQGGSLDNAPPSDCTVASRTGTAAGDAVSFDVEGLTDSTGLLNLVFRPQPGALPFQVSFKPPGDESLATIPDDSGSGTTESEDTSFQDFVPLFESEVGFFELPANDLSFGAGVTPSTTVTAPGAPRRPSAQVPGTNRRLLPSTLLAEPVADNRKVRVGAAIVFLDLLGVFLWTLYKGGRLPRAIGPFALNTATRVPIATRGIGRFASPRVGPAPRL